MDKNGERGFKLCLGVLGTGLVLLAVVLF